MRAAEPRQTTLMARRPGSWAMRGAALVPSLLLLAILAPLAHAQAPAPVTSLTVTLPPGPVTLELGAEHEIPLSVTFRAANFVCTQDATLTVPITVAGTPSELSTVMAHATPTEAKFTIPAGAYQDGVAAGNGPYNKTVEGKLTIMVAKDAPPNHAHAFLATATYNGGTPTGCQAISDMPKATGSAKHQLITGASNPASTSGADGSTMPGMSAQDHAQMGGASANNPSPAATAKKTPTTTALITVGLVGVVALLGARRARR